VEIAAATPCGQRIGGCADNPGAAQAIADGGEPEDDMVLHRRSSRGGLVSESQASSRVSSELEPVGTGLGGRVGDGNRVTEAPWLAALEERVPRAIDGRVVPSHLRPGVLHHTMLPRPHIVERLGTDTANVVLVTAPGGAGKTTALCLWAESWPSEAIGWLSLHRSLDDPTRFWFALIAAVRCARPDSAALKDLQREAVDGIDPDRLVAALDDGEPMALVIDDFHVIRDPSVLEFCSVLLARTPANVVVVIASRDPPVLSLPRLHAMGRVREVTFDDLRFDTDEVRRLVDRLAERIDEAQTERLMAASQGWPAIVSLVARIGGTADGIVNLLDRGIGAESWIAEFVVSELVDAQPPELREFLLETSFLAELSGDLCDAVRDRGDSARHITALERRELLIRLDEAGEWWRQHHLIGELLAKRATLELSDLSALRVRAAAWLHTREHYQEAIVQALAANRADLAVRSVAPALMSLQVPAGRETYWFDELPDHILLDQSEVLGEVLLYVLLMGNGRQRVRLDRLYQRALALGVPDVGSNGKPHPLRCDWQRAMMRDVPHHGEILRQWDPDDIPALWRMFWPPMLCMDAFVNLDLDRALTIASNGRRSSMRNVRRYMAGLMSIVAHEQGDESTADVVLERYDGTSWPVMAEFPVEWARGLRAVRWSDPGAAVAHFDRAISRLGGVSWMSILISMDRAAANASIVSPERAQLEFADVRRQLGNLDDAGNLTARFERIAARADVPIEFDSVRLLGNRMSLTDREIDVLLLLEEDGLTLADIGARLTISENTVKSHVRSIYLKLDVGDRSQVRSLIRSVRRG